MLTYITAAFFVVLVLAILYTFWVTHRIVAPLKKLTSVAKNITSSVQSVDLIVESDDEVGVLSRVMSETYEKIREYSSYINALAYRDSLTGIKTARHIPRRSRRSTRRSILAILPSASSWRISTI
jgi:nitrogen fixation/metabolism regulation signal transduction histidine kinase